MNISLPTKAQWIAVVINSVLAFVATFTATLIGGDINKATLLSAGVAGVMAIFKTIQKIFSEPKLS